MRFYEYLTEQELTYEQAVDTIEKKCKGIVREISKGFNIIHRTDRAMPAGKAGIKTVRTERKPKDTPPWASKLINDWFKDKFGWSARSEGLFCWLQHKNPFKDVVNDGYRSNFLVLPFDPYEYVYSTSAGDIYTDIYLYAYGNAENRKELKEMIIDELEFHSYKTTNAMKAKVRYSKEIMIKTNKAVLIPMPMVKDIAKKFNLYKFK